MRSLLIFAVITVVGTVRGGDTPYYEQIRFRDNDPFVFCTQGIKDNPRAWSPDQPIRALWRLTPGYCPVPSTGTCPVYPYTFKSWSQNDFNALRQYMSVCPQAEKEGRWRGKGKPENSPYSH